MKLCPICRNYELSNRDRWNLIDPLSVNWPKSECPDCKGEYATSHASRLLWMLSLMGLGFVGALFFEIFLDLARYTKLAGILCILMASSYPIALVLVKPVIYEPARFEYAVALRQRSIFKNAFLFVVGPVTLVVGLFLLAVLYAPT